MYTKPHFCRLRQFRRFYDIGTAERVNFLAVFSSEAREHCRQGWPTGALKLAQSEEQRLAQASRLSKSSVSCTRNATFSKRGARCPEPRFSRFERSFVRLWDSGCRRFPAFVDFRVSRGLKSHPKIDTNSSKIVVWVQVRVPRRLGRSLWRRTMSQGPQNDL